MTYDEGEVEEVEEGDADGEGDVQAEVQPDVVRHEVVLEVPDMLRVWLVNPARRTYTNPSQGRRRRADQLEYSRQPLHGPQNLGHHVVVPMHCCCCCCWGYCGCSCCCSDDGFRGGNSRSGGDGRLLCLQVRLAVVPREAKQGLPVVVRCNGGECVKVIWLILTRTMHRVLNHRRALTVMKRGTPAMSHPSENGSIGTSPIAPSLRSASGGKKSFLHCIRMDT